MKNGSGTRVTVYDMSGMKRQDSDGTPFIDMQFLKGATDSSRDVAIDSISITFDRHEEFETDKTNFLG